MVKLETVIQFTGHIEMENPILGKGPTSVSITIREKDLTTFGDYGQLFNDALAYIDHSNMSPYSMTEHENNQECYKEFVDMS